MQINYISVYNTPFDNQISLENNYVDVKPWL